MISHLAWTKTAGAAVAITAGAAIAAVIPAGPSVASFSPPAGCSTSAFSPPVVTSFSPSGGPFTGHTAVTIRGCGFTPFTQVSFGGTAAASITYVSPNQLSATTSAISLYRVGPVDVTVSNGFFSVSDDRADFTYYAPEIGRLIYYSGGQYSECTASVVNSNNQSVVLTAGHCLGSGGSFYSDFAFAPGYYGPLCMGNLSSSAAYLACGTTPYGIWTARRVATTNQWLNNGDNDLDFGFLVMEKLHGKTIQQAIHGGLDITFNPGRYQTWTSFGEPKAVLLHCRGQSSNFNGGSPGPDMMYMYAPTCAVGGSSGGPWINGSNGAFYGIGAVNKAAGDLPSNKGDLYAAYMGSEAEANFEAAENS